MECCGEMPNTKKYPDYCRTITFTDNNGVVRELVFPKALDLDRPKRARTTFSRDQLDRLEAEFSANQYLVGRERTQLAQTLGLSETQVKVWFQNRRTKHKRDKEKQDEDLEARTESLATKSLLTILQPSIRASGTHTHSKTSPLSQVSFVHNAMSRPRLEQFVRRADVDRLPVMYTSTPSNFLTKREVSMDQHSSSSFFPATGSPHNSSSFTPSSAHFALNSLSHFSMSPIVNRASSLPLCSLSSVSLHAVSLPTLGVGGGSEVDLLGRVGMATSSTGSGSDAQYRSLGLRTAVPETWLTDPYAAACQTPFGSTATPVTVHGSAAWPVFSHGLTR